MRLRATRLSSLGISKRLDPYGRVFLADAATGFLLPPFPNNYTRSGPDLWCPQADGALASFAANVIPREWANGRWGFRFDPGWTQSLLRTHDFAHSTWLKNSVVTPPTQSAVGPNGGLDAWGMVETTGSAYRNFEQQLSTVAGQVYTFTAVVSKRAGAQRFAGLRLPAVTFAPNNGAATFDLDTGAAVVQAGSGIIAKAVQLANGFWMLSVTSTATATGAGPVRIQLANAFAATDQTYTGDGDSGLNVWCSNITNTAYPVPLTVAQGTAGTVGNHSCAPLLSALGVALGSEYTIGAEWAFDVVNASGAVAASFTNGAYSDRVTLYREPNVARASAYVASSGAASYYSGDMSSVGAMNRQAIRVKPDDIRVARNGVLGGADNGSSPMPVGVDRITIGHALTAGSSVLSGSISKIWIIPSRALTDAELQAVTT